MLPDCSYSFSTSLPDKQKRHFTKTKLTRKTVTPVDLYFSLTPEAITTSRAISQKWAIPSADVCICVLVDMYPANRREKPKKRRRQ